MASSQEGASGGADAPSHVSYNITPDGKIIPASMLQSDKSISFDPEPSNVWKVPKPKFAPKMISKYDEEYKFLLRETDINRLRSYLTANYPLLESANDVRKKLQKLVETYAPPDAPIIPDMDIPVMLTWLEDILETYRRKYALYDISFESLENANLLEGSILKVKIENSRKKVSEMLKEYHDRMIEAEQNVSYISGVLAENMQLIKVYEARITSLYDQVTALKVQPGRQVADAPDQSKFFKELQKHLDHDYHLNSTFKEELAVEKKTKHSLLQEICRLNELRILDEQQKQKEIADIIKDQEMEEGLRKELIQKIKTLTPNPDDVQQAVNDWMNTIRATMSQNEATILQLKERYKETEDELAQDKIQYKDLYDQKNELLDYILELDAEINEKLEIFEARQAEIQRLDQAIENLDSRPIPPDLSQTRYYDARSTLESFRQSPEAPTHPTVESPEAPIRPTVQSPDTAFFQSQPQSPFQSPDFRDSSISRRLFHSTPQSAIDSSDDKGGSGSLSFSLDESPDKFRQESPYRATTRFDGGSPMSIHSTPRSILSSYSASRPSPYDMPSPIIQSFSEREYAIPMLGTVAIPGPSRYVPRTAVINPSSETKVTNRFDVGQSINMRTVCETSTPYQQVTRVASIIPEHGYSGSMIDQPLSIQHSAELTPTQYKTPFISKSRFGYTDPTARVFNIPPEYRAHIPTPFGAATPSRQQGISPDVVTYGTPPAVTPTTSRRHGLFTPTGIFRKKHFNVRTLYDPEFYESFELPWSSHYLPKDSRSPVSPSSPFSDRSWKERSDSQYAQNMMDRTFVAPSLPADRSFDASPQTIDRTFHVSPHPSNRTFNASPMPINRTFDASPTPINRTFDASPVPMDRTFDASPHRTDRTFNASTPYALNRTFVAPTDPINRTFTASSPQVLNRTFDAPSHVLNQTFDASPVYAVNRTFSASPPIATNQIYTAHLPISMNRTFEASPEMMNRTFTTSPAYEMDRTFNKSLSSPLGRTFQRSPSPTKNVTFAPGTSFNVRHSSDMNRSPLAYATLNRSASPVQSQSFGKSWYDPYCCNIS